MATERAESKHLQTKHIFNQNSVLYCELYVFIWNHSKDLAYHKWYTYNSLKLLGLDISVKIMQFNVILKCIHLGYN